MNTIKYVKKDDKELLHKTSWYIFNTLHLA